MRKFNSVIAGLVFVVFAVFLMVEGAEAFCVYNNTNTNMIVEQTSGHGSHGFDKKILAGENKCCNWQNKDCNKEGKRDSIVKFTVKYSPWGAVKYYYVCEDFPIRAGGSLTISGGGDRNFSCSTADNTAPPPSKPARGF